MMSRCKSLLLLLAMATNTWAEPIAVRAEPFEVLATYPTRQAPARVLSLNDSRIEAEISAAVAAIPVRVGDRVEQGDTVLELRCGDARDALTQASAVRRALVARRDFAEFQLKRARSLVKGGNISDEQLRQREAEARALAAELDGALAAEARADRDAARCQIKAPFDAVVAERLIGVGEKAAPGKPLLRLLDMAELEVSVQVQAGDVASLEQAATFELLLDGRSYPLRLRGVVPALDPLSRSREARLEFADGGVAPGSSGRLSWRSDQPHLPAEFLLRREGRYGVFLLSEGKALFHPIDEGREGAAAPLALPGESLVITEGRYGLRHGDAVRRVE